MRHLLKWETVGDQFTSESKELKNSPKHTPEPPTPHIHSPFIFQSYSEDSVTVRTLFWRKFRFRSNLLLENLENVLKIWGKC